MEKSSTDPDGHVPSTGIPELDQSLGNLTPGDNVVFGVDTIADYVPFTRALSAYAEQHGERVVYFRFAGHEPALEDDGYAIVHQTHPELGFENFITQIHRMIKEIGPGGYYVFDSLSDLTTTCYSDRMIGNFFRLTCPYLRELGAIAYFALYRHLHSYHAVLPIRETTQILIDVFDSQNGFYIQPAKIEGREEDERYRLFEWRNGTLKPVRRSGQIAAVYASSPWTGLRTAPYRKVGLWDQTFLQAEAVQDAIREGSLPENRAESEFEKLLPLILPRDEKLLALARSYLSLSDLLAIWKRMIGTGMIGGKSLGVLLSRAILASGAHDCFERLELHDSFFIGSDVFYTYLVLNDCWWERQRQKDPEWFLSGNDAVRERIKNGSFPDFILERFEDMLEYFGTAPIIVRSSSLLEDNYGNVFSGKYESVFCVNQGTLEERLESFLDAVRTIYAGTMSDEALSYRKERGVLEKDEQMALLVQRVSGSVYGTYFHPQIAGVAYSFNPYVWSKSIDPLAGVVRLVFGLGTRAVDRTDDDYTRIIALNVPNKRPESDFEAVKKHTQRRVDVLDLQENVNRSIDFHELLEASEGLPIDRFATRDYEGERRARELSMTAGEQWVLTFDRFLEETSFIEDTQLVLSTLREAYGSHVDIEFTANLDEAGKGYTMNLVQCRRFPVHTAEELGPPTTVEIPDERAVIRSYGAVMGQSRTLRIDRLIYVPSASYQRLGEAERYALAKLIGTLTHFDRERNPKIMVVGPGRWGTSTPSLGVPVSLSQINTVSVIWEIDFLREGLTPDLSLGTHFFNDLVELNTLYVAHAVKTEGNIFRQDYLDSQPSTLLELAPEAQGWEDTVRVLECSGPHRACETLYLSVDSFEQKAVLYTTP